MSRILSRTVSCLCFVPLSWGILGCGASGEFPQPAGATAEVLTLGQASSSAPEAFPNSTDVEFADAEQVRAFSSEVDHSYQFGPGDEFAFLVAHRPDISRERNIVAPDGMVSLPRAGVFQLAGMTIREATDMLEEKLSAFYEEPEVTLSFSHIHNNRVFVLGRVANPGAVNFTGSGTLLEALSLAGGLPVDTHRSFLSRCMIVRGGDKVLWIDLRDLLQNGNMALNASLRNGDFIFIPQSEDQIVYVLGQVLNPGQIAIQPNEELTLLQAISRVGGFTRLARKGSVQVRRETEGGVTKVLVINASELIDDPDSEDFPLQDGDIIFVGERLF